MTIVHSVAQLLFFVLHVECNMNFSHSADLMARQLLHNCKGFFVLPLTMECNIIQHFLLLCMEVSLPCTCGQLGHEGCHNAWQRISPLRK